MRATVCVHLFPRKQRARILGQVRHAGRWREAITVSFAVVRYLRPAAEARGGGMRTRLRAV
eukprot:3014719-Prymnesium_polylepis.1